MLFILTEGNLDMLIGFYSFWLENWELALKVMLFCKKKIIKKKIRSKENLSQCGYGLYVHISEGKTWNFLVWNSWDYF